MKSKEEIEALALEFIYREFGSSDPRFDMSNYQIENEVFIKAYEMAQPKWISIKDRLPKEKDKAYLVYIEGYINSSDAAEIAWFTEHGLQLNQYPELEKGITHWMPLPKQPTK